MTLEGLLTPDVLIDIVSKSHALKAQYPREAEISDKVYAKTEQAYADIEDFINSVASGAEEYNPYAIDSLSRENAKNLYAIRQNNIDKMINLEATTHEQLEYLQKIYDSNRTPFYYEPAES